MFGIQGKSQYCNDSATLMALKHEFPSDVGRKGALCVYCPLSFICTSSALFLSVLHILPPFRTWWSRIPLLSQVPISVPRHHTEMSLFRTSVWTTLSIATGQASENILLSGSSLLCWCQGMGQGWMQVPLQLLPKHWLCPKYTGPVLDTAGRDTKKTRPRPSAPDL